MDGNDFEVDSDDSSSERGFYHDEQEYDFDDDLNGESPSEQYTDTESEDDGPPPTR
jgi:hypothetical protein